MGPDRRPRIAHVAGRSVLAGGLLPFSLRSAEKVMQAFAVILDKDGPDTLEQTDSDDLLRTTASLFTAIWLSDTLAKALGEDLPELSNSDGEDILLQDARYAPLRRGQRKRRFAPLLLSTNSAERASRGQALIEAALCARLLTPLVEIRTRA
jgi:hypothetical protein